MALFYFLPEIAAFLIFFLMATQIAQVGPILVLIEIVLLGLILVLRAPVALQTVLKWWPLLLAPILAAVSTLWSDAPMTTLRYGVQYHADGLYRRAAGAADDAAALPHRVHAQHVRVLRRLHSLRPPGHVDGGHGADRAHRFEEPDGLRGAAAHAVGLAVLLLRDVQYWMRWIAALALPLGIYILLGVNSATALLMGIGGAAMLVVLWFTERMQPGGRWRRSSSR